MLDTLICITRSKYFLQIVHICHTFNTHTIYVCATGTKFDFSCLTVSQVGHYLYPLEPGIEQGMDHNLLQQIV